MDIHPDYRVGVNQIGVGLKLGLVRARIFQLLNTPYLNTGSPTYLHSQMSPQRYRIFHFGMEVYALGYHQL